MQLAAVAKRNERIAIVHGAGSFGHHQAKEYGVSKGQAQGSCPLNARLREGFVKTRLSVTTLSKYVVAALIEEGVPAVGISPCPFVNTASKKLIDGLPLDAIEGVHSRVNAGLVPVVHGDAVLDTVQACAILSGDIWMVHLCRELSAKAAVFFTDVDGVFTKPPTEPGAELVREIWVNVATGELELGDASVEQTASYDVTGGLLAKLKGAAEILMQAPAVEAVFIVRPGSLAASSALKGEAPKDGTTLRRRDPRC
jgi:isopentenyl phosphate kinase